MAAFKVPDAERADSEQEEMDQRCLNAPIRTLHRHRLFRCGDAGIQLQGAQGVRRRGLRRTNAGSAPAKSMPILDAAWTLSMSSSSCKPVNAGRSSNAN